MPNPDPKRVAEAFLQRRHQTKTAGEVVFKKDRGGDVNQWAYTDHPPNQRAIPKDFNYSSRHQKPLAKILRATLAALGHTLSAYNKFAKIKSARVSPDGSLGGRGYIQKIADMRKQYMNCVEALSALADTIYDEVNAPHWSLLSRQENTDDQSDVESLIQDAQAIRADPQQWAEEELAEEFDSGKKNLDELSPIDPGDWDAWDDETEVEETVPNIQTGPGVQRTAANKTVQEVRLELTRDRIAHRWINKNRNTPSPGGGVDDGAHD